MDDYDRDIAAAAMRAYRRYAAQATERHRRQRELITVIELLHADDPQRAPSIAELERLERASVCH